MKVALIGAPGSGKTKIAKKAVSLLKEIDPDWAVVDGYVDQITKQTGITFGVDANFPQNLSIITARWVKEAEYYAQNKSTITCGSIYESFLYSSYTTMFTSPDEATMTSESFYHQISMQMLGVIEKTTWDYDVLFFLPYNEKVAKTQEDTWNQVINAKLPEVLDGFNKKAILLDQKTDKAKAETIIEIIGKVNEFIASQTSTNDEQTV